MPQFLEWRLTSPTCSGWSHMGEDYTLKVTVRNTLDAARLHTAFHVTGAYAVSIFIKSEICIFIF